MAGESQSEVKLQVAGAKPEEVSKGLTRPGQRAFEAFGLREGDVVEIVGADTTAALAVRAYPEDEGLEIIRLDGLQRANAAVGIGDQVEVRRAEVKAARRIMIAPAQKNLRLQGSVEALRRTFAGRPLVAGDTLSTAGYQRTGAPPQVAAHFPQAAFALQEIRLRVVSTTPPRGVVHVAADTEIELLPEYTEPEQARRTDVTHEDLGGLGDTIHQVREMTELPLKHPELFQRLGSVRPRSFCCTAPLAPARR